MKNETATATAIINKFKGDVIMQEKKIKMDELREDFQEFLEEEGFNETISDDLNEEIENCGVRFGKFAWIRKEFLEEYHWDRYFSLVSNREKPFIEHFQNIDKRASEFYERLLPSYLKTYKNEEVARSAVEEVIIKEIVEDTSFSEEIFKEEKLTEEEFAEIVFKEFS